jgi:hypothetical protein
MTSSPISVSVPRRWALSAAYIVVLGMEICFAAVAIHFLHWLFPSWDARGVIFLGILAAVEAVASRRLIKVLPTAESQVLFYRLTEWLVVFLLLKIYVELLPGLGSFWNNFSLWLVDFPLNIFNLRTVLTSSLFFCVWAIANLFDNDLSLLKSLEDPLLEDKSRQLPLRQVILRRFLNLGMFVLLLAGIPLQKTFQIGLPLASASVVPAVLLFFILGMVLLSLSSYISLTASWQKDKVILPGMVTRQWVILTAVILAVLVLLMLLLPNNTGLGLFETLKAVIAFIVLVITVIYAFLLFILNAISSLFIHPLDVVPAETPVPTPPQQVFSPGSTPSPIDWDLVRSVIFWLVLFVLVVITLRQYILFHRSLVDDLKQLRPINWLTSLLSRLVASLRKANKRVGGFVQSRFLALRRVRKPVHASSEWDYMNPHRLGARQKVIFYYLSLIRRAKEAGLPRADGQTPYEYASSLAPDVQAGKEGIETLTNSFMEARYSLHEIPPGEAKQARLIWENLRNLFHSLRRKSGG